ncbi:hypothetical protein ACEPAH_2573 [Sanghuangporus vaninii]
MHHYRILHLYLYSRPTVSCPILLLLLNSVPDSPSGAWKSSILTSEFRSHRVASSLYVYTAYSLQQSDAPAKPSESSDLERGGALIVDIPRGRDEPLERSLVVGLKAWMNGFY